jgi:hypothetical protein
VTVEGTEHDSGGGGGAFDGLTLLALTLGVALQLARQAHRLQMTDL